MSCHAGLARVPRFLTVKLYCIIKASLKEARCDIIYSIKPREWGLDSPVVIFAVWQRGFFYCFKVSTYVRILSTYLDGYGSRGILQLLLCLRLRARL